MGLAQTIAKLLLEKIELAPFSPRLFDLRMVDVGSGDGKIALEIAKLIGAKEVILIDKENRLEVPLTSQVKFFQMDAESEEFFYLVPDADVMTCLRTFHEFSNPFSMAIKMALKTRGILIVHDWMEKGWQRILKEDQQIEDAEKRKRELSHDWEDIQKVRRNHLYTKEEIRHFWNLVALYLEGKLEYRWGIESYVVIYCSWIKIKKPDTSPSEFEYYKSAQL